MRTTTLFTLATCLAFTGIRPIAGQELTPLDRTPPTLKSMYYDVNGDGKMEYLRYPVHQNETEYRRLLRENHFSRPIPYHTPDFSAKREILF